MLTISGEFWFSMIDFFREIVPESVMDEIQKLKGLNGIKLDILFYIIFQRSY